MQNATVESAPLVESVYGVLKIICVKVSKFSKVLVFCFPTNSLSKIQTGRRLMSPHHIVVLFRFHVNTATNKFAPWVDSVNGAQISVCQKVSKYSKVFVTCLDTYPSPEIFIHIIAKVLQYQHCFLTGRKWQKISSKGFIPNIVSIHLHTF